MGEAVRGVSPVLQGMSPSPVGTSSAVAPPALSFSVIVPARIHSSEDATHLGACLRALQALTPPPLEILLVDDGSPTPLTLPAVWRGAPLRLHRQGNAGPASARNTGAAAATGDILVFVDADIEVPPNTLARLAADFAASPAAAAVWGTVTAAHPHAGFLSRYKNHTHRHFTLQQEARTRHLTTMLAAIRRQAFLAIGGFDTRLRTVSVEDVELGRDLHDSGQIVLLDKALEAAHHHRFTGLRALRNDFHTARHHARTTLDRRARGESSVSLDGPGERRQLHYLLGIPLGAGAVVALLTGRWRWSAALLAGLAAWERDLLQYLAKEEGPLFAAAALPWMAIERTTVGLAVAVGVGDHLRTKYVAPPCLAPPGPAIAAAASPRSRRR